MAYDYNAFQGETYYSTYICLPDIETFDLVMDRLGELGYEPSHIPRPHSSGARKGATYVYITHGENDLSYSSGERVYLNDNEISVGGTLATLYTREFLDNIKFQNNGEI